MHLVRAHLGTYRFEVSAAEKRLLLEVINLYPLVPIVHHRFTHSVTGKDGQQLLEEALTEHRTSQRKHVNSLLRARSRFRKTRNGWRFSLKPPQMDWLLQVLNDVRVGSWLALGSPNSPREMLQALTPKSARTFRAMEASGYFQMALIQAMDGK